MSELLFLQFSPITCSTKVPINLGREEADNSEFGLSSPTCLMKAPLEHDNSEHVNVALGALGPVVYAGNEAMKVGEVIEVDIMKRTSCSTKSLEDRNGRNLHANVIQPTFVDNSKMDSSCICKKNDEKHELLMAGGGLKMENTRCSDEVHVDNGVVPKDAEGSDSNEACVNEAQKILEEFINVPAKNICMHALLLDRFNIHDAKNWRKSAAGWLCYLKGNMAL